MPMPGEHRGRVARFDGGAILLAPVHRFARQPHQQQRQLLDILHAIEDAAGRLREVLQQFEIGKVRPMRMVETGMCWRANSAIRSS